MLRFHHVLIVLALLLHCAARAQYSWQSAFPNLPVFANPTELVHAGDGTNRLFVAQQRGIIYVFQNMPTVGSRKVFLNLSDRVSQTGNETGLLGLAFHPNYETNGYVYVNYTSSLSGSLTSYIARYQVSATNPDSAVRESELILLTVAQPYTNHNGGKLAFGPDGYLYIGFGDGGSANDPGNRAQNRSVILGKILRIDVDATSGGNNYAIPPTNPYYNNTQGWRQEIFAFGIRNPWKFSFDPPTGRLWLGDVGQDAREEIDIVVSGGNYGWRLMEGNICNPTVNPTCQDTAGLIRPVWDYPNAGADISITGGYVYRGDSIPSLYGKYIYADYGSGKVWALTYDGINPTVNTLLADEAFLISTFGVDESYQLYLCSFGSSGRIYKLRSPEAVPIQLGSFTATALSNNRVRLDWQTISEVNNYGFYCERRAQGADPWTLVHNSFVAGNGTTYEPRRYSFVENNVPVGYWQYRLKQVDLDGTEHFTEPVSVTVVTTVEEVTSSHFSLHQNFPNPFNPTTSLSFVIPHSSLVRLKVFDVLGREVATIVDEFLSEGTYTRRFTARNLPSGVYTYQMKAGNFIATKRMIVLK
jgi:glucose/arabinose dehydrogenase